MVEHFGNDVLKQLKDFYGIVTVLTSFSKGLVFHARCDCDRRSELEAHCNDLSGAFSILDAYDSTPTICYEATSLLRIPPISLDPVAEQMHSNSQALRALSSAIDELEN